MFFSSDVLLRCMYGRFCEDLIFSDFVYGDRGFSEFRFFLSWASSCVDIDIMVGVLVVFPNTDYSIRL